MLTLPLKTPVTTTLTNFIVLNFIVDKSYQFWPISDFCNNVCQPPVVIWTNPLYTFLSSQFGEKVREKKWPMLGAPPFKLSLHLWQMFCLNIGWYERTTNPHVVSYMAILKKKSERKIITDPAWCHSLQAVTNVLPQYWINQNSLKILKFHTLLVGKKKCLPTKNTIWEMSKVFETEWNSDRAVVIKTRNMQPNSKVLKKKNAASSSTTA